MRRTADWILRADRLAHRRHFPRWIQRWLCDFVDVSCGMTWSELRRERRERKVAA